MRKLFPTYRFRYTDFLLLGLVVCLNLIGIAAIGSASPERQPRQIQGMILGLVLCLFCSMIDYKKVLRWYWLWYGISFLALLAVIAAGVTRGGATRWFSIGGFQFQPSEAAKLLLILFYAKFIMKYKNRMKSFGFLALCLLIAAPQLFLIYQEPDLSTTIMVAVILAGMLFVGGMSGKLAAGIVVVAVPSAVIFLNLVVQEGSTLLDDYQRGRILAWLHPEDYATTIAYQTMNSIMAIGSGQLLGKGYNTNEISSLLNSGYISESQTDFIFTVIGEEFGFIGACIVVLLLALVAIRLFWTARETKDTAGAVLTAGVGTWIGFQGFMNIAVATGVGPNTGIPLPFVSYGLTSLLCLYAGLGFVMNVRMQNKQQHRQAFDMGVNIYDYRTDRT